MCQVKWADYLVNIKAKPREWLWPQRIPLGEITLIAGIQGMGKSLVTANLASHITTGKPWPGNVPCPQGDVILLQAEDSTAHTVRPRFDAAGVDAGRVMIVEGIPGTNKRTRDMLLPFEITNNIDRLIHLVENTKNPKAVIIDPIGSYIGNIDIHRENQVRIVMYSLKQQIAEKYKIAVIVVVHLRKGGLEDSALSRILGSVAFTGAARAVWGVAHCEEDPNRRLFMPMKHNLTAGATPGLEFFISTAPNGEGVIKWGKAIEETADKSMVDHGMKAHAKLQKAISIIQESLADGPASVEEIKEKIGQEEISWRTVQLAKSKLKVKSQKQKSQWVWMLPPEEDK